MGQHVQYLSEREIQEFTAALDKNSDGVIDYNEVQSMLDEVHHQIAEDPKPHHLHHDSRSDDATHQFLRSLMGTGEDHISTTAFKRIVEGWEVPSLEQDITEQKENRHYMQSSPLGRRLRAYWSVHGPEMMFIVLVVSMQVAFGVWQMVKYIAETQWRRALGWGVVLSKTTAGALYPTLFFLIISMSRYLSTFLRLSPSVSRFINWDLSHAFHVKISLVALGLASLHAIGHLTGTFIHGSRPRNEASVAAVFGADSVPRPYVAYVASLPGWTGITALGIFWVILIFSLPPVRRRSYEIFQLVHLLMFPMIGLLIAHGLDALLQFPMLGYWLAFPTLLVTIERVYRFGLGFYHIPAKMDILDGETVCITVTLPKCRIWRYRAGQYILLQVPQVSLFQWHPITISTCLENKIQVHIKTDGNWTQKLRRLGVDRNPQLQYVGIDGPFGAPAQSFYQFDHTLIMGSGIGVTPFSGILTDLQARTTKIRLSGASHASHPAMRASTSQDALETKDRIKAQDEQPPLRTWDTCKTVDFHWIVKDRNHLLWFSDLLNTLSVPRPSNPSGLHIRITTHVTQKRRNITAHVFRYLLETHRTPEHPASPLTGLLNPTHFGRPCLATIMEEHYESMKHLCIKSGGFSMQRKRVGVFFCGAPVIGYELADRCRLLTLRGREDGTRIEYHFSTEVF